MPTVKRLLCLANSRKLNGRCVAGIELSGSRRVGWIRPVSHREHEEVSEYERQYADGSDPRVMDLMDVPLICQRPTAYQTENWLLDPNCYWQKVGTATWSNLEHVLDPAAPLWVDEYSTSTGTNDKIPITETSGLRSSLRLLRVHELTLAVFKPGEAFGNPKRRVQARFVHHSAEYRLWVTDPEYERRYLAQTDGEYHLNESFLTLSLGEPYNGACYKLVAAIMERRS